MKRIVLLALFASLASSVPAMAGMGKGNGEMGIDFGYARFDQNVSTRAGGVAFSFRGGYNFTKLFELEGQLGGLATRIDVIGEDITLGTAFVNGVFSFHSKSGNVVPYVLGGAGHARLEFKVDGLDNSHSGSATHLAGGCRLFFGKRKRVAIRLEADFIREKTFDTASNHKRVVAGFTWRLGQK